MDWDNALNIVGGVVGGGALGTIALRLLDKRKAIAEARKIEAEARRIDVESEEALSEGQERFIKTMQGFYETRLGKLENRVQSLEKEGKERDKNYTETLGKMVEHDQAVIEANTKMLRTVNDNVLRLGNGISSLGECVVRIESTIEEWRMQDADAQN